MKLITKELAEQLPQLGATEGQEQVVRCKFFYPDFSWTWYGIEWDGEDIFYGLVDGFELELGDFSLVELEAGRGKWGMRLERDLRFEPVPLDKLMEQLQKERGGR